MAVTVWTGISASARKTKSKGIILLIVGDPLKKPVVWGGPIVMNTQDELNLTFKELDENIFIK